jgi:putative tributyrin esterase
MALFEVRFYSESLTISAAMHVITPEHRSADKDWSTLYLLHGWSDDHSIWLRRTAIERYVKDLPLVVVMPAIGKSYYANMLHGYRYWDFISEELPARVREFFQVRSEREYNFTAGNSMGGYGAFKLGLAYPERYAACASLAGALDVDTLFNSDIKREPGDARLIFGQPPIIPDEDNLFTLVKKKKWGQYPTKFNQWCGTEDFLYNDNIRFRDHAQSFGLPLEYGEGPGAHEWEPWDTQIRKVVDWLPIPGK